MVSPSSNSYPIVRAIVAFFRREERTTFIIGGTLFANEMASFSPRRAVDVLFGFSTWDPMFHVKRTGPKTGLDKAVLIVENCISVRI